MAGSTFGTHFQITTWGESHGKALGTVVDGVPAGLPLCEADIQPFLDRRRPGQNTIATPRKEDDLIEILSGVFEGHTTGTPISLLIRNTSQRSGDYNEIASYYRPGHADYTFDSKYGFRDYRGGGRSSGRETASRVAGGAVAIKFLESLGIHIRAYTKSIGPVAIDPARFDPSAILTTPTAMPDPVASLEAEKFLLECMQNKDSAGGVVECMIEHLPAGIGEPVFHKLDAALAKAILSIGAVKAFEIGDGFRVSTAKGSENNDAFLNINDKITKETNHSGGILGGISDGSPIVLRAHFKPTPSVGTPQSTVTRAGEAVTVTVKGRNDPVIVPRAVVVVEAMTALTVADLLLYNLCAKLSSVQQFYGK